MVNTGLYQFAIDAITNGVNISPYMIKTYFNGVAKVSMFANYTHRFDMNFSSLNINPKVETYLYRDWYLVVGGTYNFSHQIYEERTFQRSFFYLEFSIKKRWGLKEKAKSKKELRTT